MVIWLLFKLSLRPHENEEQLQLVFGISCFNLPGLTTVCRIWQGYITLISYKALEQDRNGPFVKDSSYVSLVTVRGFQISDATKKDIFSTDTNIFCRLKKTLIFSIVFSADYQIHTGLCLQNQLQQIHPCISPCRIKPLLDLTSTD